MSDTRKIVEAHIAETPGLDFLLLGAGGPATVTVTLEDGEQLDVFSYYPDELTFTASEFVGLTLAQARELHYRRDLTYLRS